MIVVGSRALAVHAAQRGQNFRTPGDLDILCTFPEMNVFMLTYGLKPVKTDNKQHWLVETLGQGMIEFHVALSPEAPEGSAAVGQYLAVHKNWSKYYVPLTTQVFDTQLEVASIGILFSMKRSHRFLPRQWEKHIRDYHMLKGWLVDGADIMPEVTAVKQAETKTLKTPSLNKTKVDFFDDHVSNRTFEHDQIHEIMAHRERPMFEYIKDDPLTVKCNKDKWNALPQEDKMKCVLEEAYVIALERGIIPMLYEGKRVATNESCLQWSLMRICTTLCSGWFRDWAVENYPAIWNARDKKYGQKFLQAVEAGRIHTLPEKRTP